MTYAPRVPELAPLSSDLEAAVGLSSRAIIAACRVTVPAQDPAPRIEFVGKQLRSGKAEGRLFRIDGVASGIAIWESDHPAGLHVHLFYIDPASASLGRYRDFIQRVRVECGAIALIPGSLVGLTAPDESDLLRGLGFGPFGRSEMRLPPEAPVPSARVSPGLRLRTVEPTDELAIAKLHAAAFGSGFDYYLFQVDTDPVRDSALAVRDMLSGRYGEFLSWASFLAETEAGVPRGACLFVRAPYGPLLVSVHVDPAGQGGGIGQALVVASVTALRTRGESVIALNVTEGNRRAIALYERLGFVRSIGPEWGWYSLDRVPVAPDGSASHPP